MKDLTIHSGSWGASRTRTNIDEKIALADFFARHLVRETRSPGTTRETVATILVNQGTTPTIVVQEALRRCSERK